MMTAPTNTEITVSVIQLVFQGLDLFVGLLIGQFQMLLTQLFENIATALRMA